MLEVGCNQEIFISDLKEGVFHSVLFPISVSTKYPLRGNFLTLNLQFLLIKAPLHSNPVFFLCYQLQTSRIKRFLDFDKKNSQIFSTACNISFPITSNHGTFCSDLKESFQKKSPKKFVQDILFYIKSESQNNAPHLMFTQWCM